MLGIYNGVFTVSAEFANDHVMGDWGDVRGGEWLVVCRDRDGGMVYVVDCEYQQMFVELYAKCCMREDELNGRSRDYEIWHVVERPDWMPDEYAEVTACEVIDAVEIQDGIEYLVRVNFDASLGLDAVTVHVNRFGDVYSWDDWQCGEQPETFWEFYNNVEPHSFLLLSSPDDQYECGGFPEKAVFDAIDGFERDYDAWDDDFVC